MRKLTKSLYLSGNQCHKLLWFLIHDKEKKPREDDARQFRGILGKKVGELARKYFDKGYLIDSPSTSLRKKVKATNTALQKGAPILFDAAVEYGELICKADVLVKVTDAGEEQWDLYEVKMSSRIKTHHIDEIAFQRYCFEGIDVRIRNTYITHLDINYVRQKSILPQKLFKFVDVTELVLEQLKNVDKAITSHFRVLKKKAVPDIAAGKQCFQPYFCEFYDLCNQPPEPYSVNELPFGGEIVTQLKKDGIQFIKDIPENLDMNRRQKNLVVSTKKQKAVIEKKSIKLLLDNITYPLFFLDFETINSPLPPFSHSRPYQSIPFQFSLHIQREENSTPEVFEFLAKEREDPRPELTPLLLDLLEDEGTIIAYGMVFEKKVIRELARDMPCHAQLLSKLLPRFWDLLLPFKKGYYVHYNFHGSASLKSVLPVMVPELSYEHLVIREGGTASYMYEKWIWGEMNEAIWKKAREDLGEYCKMDSYAMVKILEVLRQEVESM